MLELKLNNGGNIEGAKLVGKDIALKAKKKNRQRIKNRRASQRDGTIKNHYLTKNQPFYI